MSCNFWNFFFRRRNAAAAFSSGWIGLLRFFFKSYMILFLIIVSLPSCFQFNQSSTWNEQKTNTYQKYTVGCMCFGAMVCVTGDIFHLILSSQMCETWKLNNGKTNKLPDAGNPVLVLHIILIWILYTQVLLIYTQI